ncbi:MAG: DUF169 domain-containing protein [Acidobacteriaceae bacterium]|nr:DUF169 domain-containing protein [Acidobacteriaceae bacterium]
MDYAALEQDLMRVLGLEHRPIGIAFADIAPQGVKRFQGTVPSGCSFWKQARERGAFYTEASDHYNCAIGCYTHRIDLPPERTAELDQTLGFMMSAGYIKPEDLPAIARLARTPSVVVYARLGESPVKPDVVLFTGKPGRIMLLQEAAIRAGVNVAPLHARPTCMSLPAALDSGVVASSACVGNRVYTGLGDDELYVAVRGEDLPRIAAELDAIISSNAKLEEYHKQRLAQLAAS